jgi:3-hydroxyacyl-CoA dehydrogenase
MDKDFGKDERRNAVVLGAAGKMGSGIALLLLQEMALREGGQLILLDINTVGFGALKNYLRKHLTAFGERSINLLRERYAGDSNLIDNEEIINAFVMQGLDKVRCVSAFQECKDANLIFEAIVEDAELKADILRKVASYAHSEAYYFSNTSSIPIHLLQKKSGLKGRLIGFHFYNPPPVQQLVEIIIPDDLQLALKEKAIEIAKNLNKTVVFSKDVAGFIGNGHFIREIVEACQIVRSLEELMPRFEAVAAVNLVTQEFLLRPMGIFQLIDYVGIDVCQLIQRVMTDNLSNGPFTDSLIDEMISSGIKGGQHPDGSQKEGFFQYSKGYPIAVYNLESQKYQTLSTEKLGPLPTGHITWKVLTRDKARKEKLAAYFAALWQENTLGAEIAQTFLNQSRAIAHLLVDSGVAKSIDDVNTVLEKGFYHLYGVDDPFMVYKSRGRWK